MSNRKQSFIVRHVPRLVVRGLPWVYGLLVCLAYVFLLAWLHQAVLPAHATVAGWWGEESDLGLRPSELFVVPEPARWQPPGDEHRFGTTAADMDLGVLSQVAMRNSLWLAVVLTSVAVACALVVVMGCLALGERVGERVIQCTQRWVGMIPLWFILLIWAGGTVGRPKMLWAGVVVLMAFCLTRRLLSYAREIMMSPAYQMGGWIGLRPMLLLRKRVFPRLLREGLASWGSWLPQIVLLEMTLSFLGLAGDRLSVGSMVSYGRRYLLEAPWLAVGPGIMASVIVALLTLLGFLLTLSLKAKPQDRTW